MCHITNKNINFTLLQRQIEYSQARNLLLVQLTTRPINNYTKLAEQTKQHYEKLLAQVKILQISHWSKLDILFSFISHDTIIT